jgi:hypothetical protein
VTLIGLPGLEMVAGCQEAEAGLRRRCAEPDQFWYGELFVGQHVPDHFLPVQGGLGSRCVSC